MNDLHLAPSLHGNAHTKRNRCVQKTTVFETRRPRRTSHPPQLIGYARVSTKGQNHRLQIDALKAAGCTRIVRETASGADWDRPLLKKLVADLRAGDTVIVWRVDRWARDLLFLLQTTRDMERLGVQFRSVTEPFDLKTPLGRFMMIQLGAFAEHEYLVNHVRTEAGLVAAKNKGHLGGRPSRLSADKLLIAREMLAAAATVPEVAGHLGVGTSTLYKHLRD